MLPNATVSIYLALLKFDLGIYRASNSIMPSFKTWQQPSAPTP